MTRKDKCVYHWVIVATTLGLMALSGRVHSQEHFKAPRIWDSEQLATWGLPRAYANLHENYISEEDYYASPAFNVRTYPVYHPEKEPAGYWEWLQQQEPEPLVKKGLARTRDEWVRLGRTVFDELDQVGFRTDDPDAIAFLRDSQKFVEDDVTVAADGTIPKLRWVVERKGKIKLGLADCVECHLRVLPDGSTLRGAPSNQKLGGLAFEALLSNLKRFHGPRAHAVSDQQLAYQQYGVPWIEDDVHERLRTMETEKLETEVLGFGIPGVVPRVGASPYWITKIPDLRGVKHRYFLDATATHLNREPADIARYAALVMYGESMTFGHYRLSPKDAPRPLYHIEDDVLFALAMFLYSLEPAENPLKNKLNPVLVTRGRAMFEEQDCARCHTPPDYGGDMLLPVEDYSVPEDHPFEEFIGGETIDTDSGLALKTRKGTGLYKIPSLRGLWYRGLYGHSGSVNSLEDWFDPDRLKDDYVPSGWKGPGVEKRAVPGHEFGLYLSQENRAALIAFLNTL